MARSKWKAQGIKNKDGSWFLATDFDQLYETQNGRCAICDKHQSEMKRTLCVDHDHRTGIARGLLCDICNYRLVVIEDVDFTESAKEYLGGES